MYADYLTGKETFKLLADIRKCCKGRTFEAVYTADNSVLAGLDINKVKYLYINGGHYIFRLETRFLNPCALNSYMSNVRWTSGSERSKRSFGEFSRYLDSNIMFKSRPRNLKILSTSRLLKRMSRVFDSVEMFSMCFEAKRHINYKNFADFGPVVVELKGW